MPISIEKFKKLPKKLETRVKELLEEHGYKPDIHKKINGLCGSWQVDLYIETIPPVVIECKNPSKRSKYPYSVIPILAKEAFTMFYDLKHYSDLPEETRFILIYGDLPLKTPEMDFHKLLQQALGVYIVSINEREKLLEFIPKPKSTRK